MTSNLASQITLTNIRGVVSAAGLGGAVAIIGLRILAIIRLFNFVAVEGMDHDSS
jgi:Na+/alanine symporter